MGAQDAMLQGLHKIRVCRDGQSVPRRTKHLLQYSTMPTKTQMGSVLCIPSGRLVVLAQKYLFILW